MGAMSEPEIRIMLRVASRRHRATGHDAFRDTLVHGGFGSLGNVNYAVRAQKGFGVTMVFVHSW